MSALGPKQPPVSAVFCELPCDSPPRIHHAHHWIHWHSTPCSVKRPRICLGRTAMGLAKHRSDVIYGRTARVLRPSFVARRETRAQAWLARDPGRGLGRPTSKLLLPRTDCQVDRGPYSSGRFRRLLDHGCFGSACSRDGRLVRAPFGRSRHTLRPMATGRIRRVCEGMRSSVRYQCIFCAGYRRIGCDPVRHCLLVDDPSIPFCHVDQRYACRRFQNRFSRYMAARNGTKTARWTTMSPSVGFKKYAKGAATRNPYNTRGPSNAKVTFLPQYGQVEPLTCLNGKPASRVHQGHFTRSLPIFGAMSAPGR